MGIGNHIEHLESLHLARRVDVVDALGSHVHLVAPCGAHGGNNLAIDVARSHHIAVVEVDSTNAAACQHLDGISTHTAHAKHRHTAPGECLNRLIA